MKRSQRPIWTCGQPFVRACASLVKALKVVQQTAVKSPAVDVGKELRVMDEGAEGRDDHFIGIVPDAAGKSAINLHTANGGGTVADTSHLLILRRPLVTTPK